MLLVGQTQQVYCVLLWQNARKEVCLRERKKKKQNNKLLESHTETTKERVCFPIEDHLMCMENIWKIIPQL